MGFRFTRQSVCRLPRADLTESVRERSRNLLSHKKLAARTARVNVPRDTVTQFPG